MNYLNHWHGMLIAFGGALLSYIEILTPILQFGSVTIGCLIGAITLTSKIRNEFYSDGTKSKKNNNRKGY